MDFLDLLGLLLLAATAWLWLDSLKAREQAVAAAKAACNSEDLLLLDDTVAIQRLSLGRDGEGVLRIRRVYGFEYSGTGNDRSAGSIAMLGSHVLVINLNLSDTPEGKVLRGPWN
ncbi:MAG: DUF3301 domain-containing protein [Sulfuritalea sp.]|jgi:hypothetical protein|nr:DUF3301 domain-containing protein [Sulfuritalea sp.]